MEITWYNGKKVLDSRQTNYSYGNLQKVLAYGLSKLHIDLEAETLVLGLGGGSVIASLRKDFAYHQPITAVEFDKKIIQISQEDFHISQYHPLQIIHCDAFDYVKSCEQKFGLIIVDLFIDDKVPTKFYQAEFWNSLGNLLQENGSILFNAGIREDTEQLIETLVHRTLSAYKISKLHPPEKHNRLLIIRHVPLK